MASAIRLFCILIAARASNAFRLSGSISSTALYLADAMDTAEVKQAPIVVAKLETKAVKITNLTGESENESAATDTIKIISKNTIAEKDRWLHEAYAAYLRG